MSERPQTPDEFDVMRAMVDEHAGELHTSFPARVDSYDASKQVCDLVPVIKNPVLQPDGSYVYENFPKLPHVPVRFARTSGFSITFPIARGDFVMVHCAESSFAAWRVGNGDPQCPGDLRRHHLAHAWCVPGIYPVASKLTHASATDLVIGQNGDDGTRIAMKPDGSVVITQGAAVVAQIDADGTVHVGGAAGDLVALANLVKARIDTIQVAFDTHTHATAGGTGTPSPPASLIGPLADVAATKAKAV